MRKMNEERSSFTLATMVANGGWAMHWILLSRFRDYLFLSLALSLFGALSFQSLCVTHCCFCTVLWASSASFRHSLYGDWLTLSLCLTEQSPTVVSVPEQAQCWLSHHAHADDSICLSARKNRERTRNTGRFICSFLPAQGSKPTPENLRRRSVRLRWYLTATLYLPVQDKKKRREWEWTGGGLLKMWYASFLTAAIAEDESSCTLLIARISAAVSKRKCSHSQMKRRQNRTKGERMKTTTTRKKNLQTCTTANSRLTAVNCLKLDFMPLNAETLRHRRLPYSEFSRVEKKENEVSKSIRRR